MKIVRCAISWHQILFCQHRTNPSSPTSFGWSIGWLLTFAVGGHHHRHHIGFGTAFRIAPFVVKYLLFHSLGGVLAVHESQQKEFNNVEENFNENSRNKTSNRGSRIWEKSKLWREIKFMVKHHKINRIYLILLKISRILRHFTIAI